MTVDPRTPASSTDGSGTGSRFPTPPSLAGGSPTQRVISSTNTFKPTEPKFGGIRETGTDVWAAWTGGEPTPDWQGLKQPNPNSIVPTQFRSTSISGAAKSRVYRIQGLENKFTHTGDLQTFQRKIMKHLVTYGLDTITYVQNPSDATKVASVIENHGLFHFKTGVKDCNDNKANHFDSYCHSNDEDAKEFLFNSLDADLEKQLYNNCDKEDSFGPTWLHLIHIVRSVSIERFDKIKQVVKLRKISDYPGENIESLCDDFIQDWEDLHSARMYDHNLTMTHVERDHEGRRRRERRLPFPTS